MEYSCIEYSDSDMVDSDVRSLEDKEAIAHDSESYVGFRVASISELIFVKNNLSVMNDWIVLT